MTEAELRERVIKLARYANGLSPRKLKEPLDPIAAGALEDWIAAIQLEATGGSSQSAEGGLDKPSPEQTPEVAKSLPPPWLMEKLAAIEHERWADWQAWLHTKLKKTPKGMLMTPGYYEHLEYQIAADYNELTEAEKQSDREQVERYWPLIEQYIAGVFDWLEQDMKRYEGKIPDDLKDKREQVVTDRRAAHAVYAILNNARKQFRVNDLVSNNPEAISSSSNPPQVTKQLLEARIDELQELLHFKAGESASVETVADKVSKRLTELKAQLNPNEANHSNALLPETPPAICVRLPDVTPAQMAEAIMRQNANNTPSKEEHE